MQQTQAYVTDLRLDTERRVICKGSFLVKFEYLNWNLYTRRDESKKRPDPERIERIKRIFRREGCLPQHLEHHIPAVIDQPRFDAALEDARRKGRWKGNTLPINYDTINSQDGYTELEVPGGIECLRGRHRIEAGKVWLPPTEKWWIVDLYLEGISYELETLLIEEYANEDRPCDGKIYRKIREYQCLPGQGDNQVSPITCVSLEMRWWARFNQNREKRLRGLFRNRMLTAGFDALSKITGLFDAGMMVTTLHTMLATRCYEQIQCYLEYTLNTWVGFLKGIQRGLQRVDTVTVKDVELRAPAASTLDAEYLRGKILGGAIFSNFSARERAMICVNVLAFKGVITSLFTFFQDVHLLEACVTSFKLLITVESDQTLYTALGREYTNRRHSEQAQASETTQTASPRDCLRLGYLQLFAFALRNYHHLSTPPSKENVKEMPRARADPEVIQQFAVLAAQLGFRSPQIDALTIASETLAPSSTDNQDPSPILVTTGPGERIKHRHGLPRINTFKEDRKYLSLHNLCEERNDVGEGITSFFVLKSWFIAFFDPPRGLTRGDISTESLGPLPAPVVYQQAREEDESMEEAPLGTTSWREVEQTESLDLDAQTPETVRNEPSREASATLQEEESTLFVPAQSATQGHTSKAGSNMQFRFVFLLGSERESEMFDPFRQDYSFEKLMPTLYSSAAKVAEAVESILTKHKSRACDKHKKYIPAEECYDLLCRAENNYTLFFIPDEEYKRKGQRLDLLEGEMTGINNDVQKGLEPEYEVDQNMEEDPQPTDAPEELYEMDAAANAHIFDEDTTIIYLKRRVGDSHDVSKPAKDCTWVDMDPIGVATNDPQDTIGRTLRRIWQEAHLKPHDKNLRILEYSDCYKVAVEADDHTLYLMAPSPQNEEERAAERIWIPSHPLPADFLHWQKNMGRQKKVSRRRTHATKQAQGDIGFGSSEFIPPSNVPIPLLLQDHGPLVEPKKGDHKDKIAAGPRVKGSRGPSRIGMSIQEEEPNQIRKGKMPMRITQQPTGDQPKGHSSTPKLIKPQSHRIETISQREMAEAEEKL